MRTALILLLLLALAAVPGLDDPAGAASTPSRPSQLAGRPPDADAGLREARPLLVYGSPWFSAIYILLMVSLVGCIVPRTFVYCARHARQAAGGAAQPDPAARPRVVRTTEPPEVVLERARGAAASAALPAAAATPTATRGQRRARLPARGRQPGLPPVGAGGAGRLRAGQPVRLQGRRDPGASAARLRQQPHAVRRLRARQPLPTPTTWSRSPSPSTTSTSTG